MLMSSVSRRLCAAAACLACAAAAFAQAELSLIPRPDSVQSREGRLTLRPGCAAALPAGCPESYGRALSEAAGFGVARADAPAAAAIRFLPADRLPSGAAPKGEGYALLVTPDALSVYASTPAGHFYGLQTAAQLLRAAPRENGSVALPGVEIRDAPRFGWRGYMLDEARHFSGREAVMRLLDAMAYYKLNRLHWHLTDSSGWRLEIKAYPKLTEVGSRGSETDRRPDAPAQFYTQAEIREIVAYAWERQIAIVPEVEMPGHADAAVLSYPELDGGGYVQKGRTDKWPRFTFNPAKPETLVFLDTVLKETAALFPGAGVIHFGGDEVHFGCQKWPSLPEVQSLMKKEGFTTIEEVETWFNRRMAASVNGLGFKTGGWDEVAARDLPRDKTVVFWWRHDKPQVLRGVLDAGYPVVLCPRRPCYFDFLQLESHTTGRRWSGINPLGDVYAFPEGLGLQPSDEAKVLGLQACLWAETTVSQARRDFLTWPRLVALAEAAWTPQARKDFASFQSRLPAHLQQLRARGIGFYDPFANSPEITDSQTGKPKAHLD